MTTETVQFLTYNNAFTDAGQYAAEISTRRNLVHLAQHGEILGRIKGVTKSNEYGILAHLDGAEVICDIVPIQVAEDETFTRADGETIKTVSCGSFLELQQENAVFEYALAECLVAVKMYGDKEMIIVY